MGKELKVHSDAAYDAAHRLAEETGQSVDAVVEVALRDLAARPAAASDQDVFSEEAIARRRAELDAVIAWINRNHPPGGSYDHSDMYDENGLPI
ncbi:type II toxin-antitoxin system VapB family antitoxin [Salinarimonas sp.]|uniref:type II toxin-antitoxin system VapB family antitoxin n=1 Tax=Salinarimonas sp. TaxID=2766526 RepID=UPI0032D971BC